MIDLNSFPIFTENKATLKEISKDDSDYKNIRYMTELLKEAVSFDLVKRHYVNGLGLSEEVAASVDAVVQIGETVVFIEFKNGKVNNRNVKDKIRDSLLIFNDITGKNIAYTREKVELVVVYNCEKNPLPNQLKKGKTQESPSRTAISDYFTAKGQKELILFDLERYENLYFGRVHTYSPERFEAYLNGELNRELH